MDHYEEDVMVEERGLLPKYMEPDSRIRVVGMMGAREEDSSRWFHEERKMEVVTPTPRTRMKKNVNQGLVVHGSNCVFDDSLEQQLLGGVNNGNMIAVTASSTTESSVMSSSSLLRRRSTQLSTLLGTQEPGRFQFIRKCLTWRWLQPVIMLAISVILLLLGMSCLTHQLYLFETCAAVFLPTGLLFPLICLLATIYFNQRSVKSIRGDAFYSDALLEEVLSGENILDIYSVTTRQISPSEGGNVVVFLSGVGGVPETWKQQVEAVVDAGFSAITVQMPGSGALSAVMFSLSRAERVVRRVLEDEMVLGSPDDDDYDEEEDDDIERRIRGEFQQETQLVGSPRPGTTSHKQKVVLVGYGLSCHVAMYLASSRRLGNKHLAGVVLLGSPILPLSPTSWFQRFLYKAFRVSWIAQGARLSEYAGFPSEIRRTVHIHSLHPEARADWGYSFESHREGLIHACSDYVGPVLCISGDKTYIKEVKSLFGTSLQEPGSNVEGVHVRGLGKSGFRSYSSRHNKLYSRQIIQFASAAYI